MAKKRILNDKIEKVYKPIDWSIQLIPKGGSAQQQHDVDNDLYYPDREVTPLLIEPEFRIIDRDKKASRIANNELTGISWKYIYLGDELACNTPDFDVFTEKTSDVVKGAIMVNRNVAYLQPITLVFYAEYYDKNRKRTLTIRETIPLSTNPSASLALFTKLDVPPAVICNPFELEANPLEVIKPIYQIGDKTVTENVKGWWYKVVNGEEIAVNVDTDLCFESLVGDVLTVRKDFVRETLFRFKSAFFPDGNIPTTPPANCNVNDVWFIRRYPNVEFEQKVSGQGFVSGAATSFLGELIATTADGVVSEPDKYWTAVWKMKSTAAGSSYSVIGRGFGPHTFAFALYAADLQIEISDKGPMAALIDNDGKILVDNNDKAICVRLDE